MPLPQNAVSNHIEAQKVSQRRCLSRVYSNEALMVDFIPSHALQGEASFNSDDVLGGVQPHPEWRHQAGRIWVEVGGRAESIRFYGALCADRKRAPLIYLEGDVMGRGNKATGPISVGAWYSRLSPLSVQAEAEQFTIAFDRPFINLARPDVFGSSGNHGERRREREVALIDAALDCLKARFGWAHLHLAGQSGGGHLVAALVARRSDVGCAVIASGNVAVRRRNLMRGMAADATGYDDFVDPIELVSEVA